MRKFLIKRIFPTSLIISLLLHLLLLLSLTTFIIWQPKEEQKAPDLYTPSYIYKGGITQAAKVQQVKKTKSTASSESPLPKSNQPQKQFASKEKNKVHRRSVLSMTYDLLQQNQHEMLTQLKQEQDPIYLVGDKNSPVDPLVRLLGRALSAHFEYPREAGLFGIRGRAVVGLTLHPNGRLTDIQLIQSTDNPDLDAAALYAVNAAPLVYGANKFISAPKYFVVGFIFH